ncbi:protein kinase [Streptomonospora sp. S1-112]|uniref:non-specific serine/threonine protein kinase n=1 Tax=Streptomonospora mangrovi TaxID=2883123 RepID=A0A9X3NZ67_9ACTN|nr:serine/threonine-protein kinase [Streptomonospora mangrovi]MDA0567111.1 protein kinase [Streptomonospora mangrovi]
MGEAETAGGDRFAGPYRLVRRLGRGGFGDVFMGEAPDGARAAVKLLHTSWAQDEEMRRRFAAEVEQARKVGGFCIAPILDADCAAEQPWIASEYIEGPTLTAAVRDEGPRRGAALQRLAVSTATALAAIHGAGVVHRDLKPDNILLAADGPRVIDFGIARAVEATSVTASGVVGTVGYMAPEQLEGLRLTAAVDVFAWGAVMVYAATGREAFAAPTQAARATRILTGEPDTGDLGEPLLSVVLACLDKDPARRPTARGLLDLLLGAAPGGPVVVGGAPGSEPGVAPAPDGGAEAGTEGRTVVAPAPGADATRVEPVGAAAGEPHGPGADGGTVVEPTRVADPAAPMAESATRVVETRVAETRVAETRVGPPAGAGEPGTSAPGSAGDGGAPEAAPGTLIYTSLAPGATRAAPAPGAAESASGPAAAHASGAAATPAPPHATPPHAAAPGQGASAFGTPPPHTGAHAFSGFHGAAGGDAVPPYWFTGRRFTDPGELAAAMQANWSAAVEVFGSEEERAALGVWLVNDIGDTLVDRALFRRRAADANVAVAWFIVQLRPDLPPVFRGRDASVAALRERFAVVRPAFTGAAPDNELMLLARSEVLSVMALHAGPDSAELRKLADDLEAAERAAGEFRERLDRAAPRLAAHAAVDSALILSYLLRPELVGPPDAQGSAEAAEWFAVLWSAVEGAPTPAARAGVAAAVAPLTGVARESAARLADWSAALAVAEGERTEALSRWERETRLNRLGAWLRINPAFPGLAVGVLVILDLTETADDMLGWIVLIAVVWLAARLAAGLLRLASGPRHGHRTSAHAAEARFHQLNGHAAQLENGVLQMRRELEEVRAACTAQGR